MAFPMGGFKGAIGKGGMVAAKANEIPAKKSKKAKKLAPKKGFMAKKGPDMGALAAFTKY